MPFVLSAKFKIKFYKKKGKKLLFSPDPLNQPNSLFYCLTEEDTSITVF